ncbi:MAG: EAL domain-containing protein [Spirochaetota bacterium]|nr:EAL domain-containing protein [Spirochaetota bacterium]
MMDCDKSKDELIKELTELREKISHIDELNNENILLNKKLKNTKSYIRNILDNSLDLIVVVDKERKITEFNKIAQNTFGYKYNEIFAKSIDILYYDNDEYIKVNNILLEHGQFSGELINKRKDGTTFPTYTSISNLIDSNNNILGFISVSRDTSKNKLIEANLKNTRQFNQNLIDCSLDMIIAVDKNRKIIEFNKAAQKTFGYSYNEVIWKNIQILYDNDIDGNKINKYLLENGQFVGEVTNKRKDGTSFPTYISASKLVDSEGNFIGFMGISREITEQKNLEKKWHEYEFIVNTSKERMSLINKDHIYEAVNDAYCLASKKTREEIVGKSITEVWGEFRYFQHIKNCIEQCFNGQEVHDYDWFDFAKNERRCFDIIYYPYFDENNTVTHAVVVSRDITERKLTEEKLNLAAEVYGNTSEAIMITDTNGIILDVNQAFVNITGYTQKEVIKESPKILKSIQHNKDFYKNIFKEVQNKGKWHGELWIQCKNGENCPILLAINVLKNEEKIVTHYVSIFSDITSLKLSEERLQYLAYHDTLTDLPNRALLHDRLRQAFLQSDRHHFDLAIMLLDLDHFKNVNDTFGHHAGDQLLKDVSERLLNCVRGVDTVARLGGDEFVILLNEISGTQGITKVAQKIIESFSSPFNLDAREIFVTPSIGISIYPTDASNLDDLLKSADIAMYHAKKSGRNNFQFYSLEINTRTLEQMEMMVDLRRALDNSELEIYYQPQVDCNTKNIVGIEALLRWNSPKHGMVLPDKFIPLAEESGLIVPIGEWVLLNACRQIKIWHEEGFNSLRVAVNLSWHQFRQKNLVEKIYKILEDCDLEGKYLELEITENILMQEVDLAIKILMKLKEMGIRIAIDDFGTGYSSLNYLKQFPIDTLKIDKSFVSALYHGSDDAAIVSAVISMGHNLNMNIVAEGIENKDNLSFLVNNKCNEGQGYYFSRPLSADAFYSLLKSKSTHSK